MIFFLNLTKYSFAFILKVCLDIAYLLVLSWLQKGTYSVTAGNMEPLTNVLVGDTFKMT